LFCLKAQLYLSWIINYFKKTNASGNQIPTIIVSTLLEWAAKNIFLLWKAITVTA